MLLSNDNPYRPALPRVLTLGWDDFRFALSPSNEQAIGCVAEWSVMAYLAADCDLAPHIYDDLLEMKSIGSSNAMHVCAMFDGPLLTDAFFARLHAQTPISEDLVARWRDVRSNRRQTLTMALELAAAWPGRRRLLILGGHGAGWRGMLVDRDIGREYQTTPGRLELPGPARVCVAQLLTCQQDACDRINRRIESVPIPSSPRYDLMALDACYMGNLETVAAFTDHAEILVVSEDLMPGDGLPYDRVLGDLATAPAQPTLDVARKLVNATASNYARAGGRPVTQVALRTAGFPVFAAAFVRLVQVLTESLSDNDVYRATRYALNMAYRFGRTGFVDVVGFVRTLAAKPLPAVVAGPCMDVLAKWQQIVIATTAPGTTGTPNGLSIYAPEPSAFDVAYIPASNDFAHSLGIWAWFLARYYQRVLGEDAPAHPLLEAIRAKMVDLIQRGEYQPGNS